MPDLLPDLWPWEVLWPAAIVGALWTLALIVVRAWRRRPGLPRRLLALLTGCLLLIGAPYVLFDDWMGQVMRRENIAETSPQAADLGLRTRIFHAPPSVVFGAAVRVVEHTPFWHLTLQDPASGIIKAQVTAALGLFTDDVLIRIDPANNGFSQVNLRASARLSGGDLGVSVRPIVIFYRRLSLALEGRPA